MRTIHTDDAPAHVGPVPQAVEAAGTLDPKAVRDAIAKLNFDSLYGKIAFAENGQIDLAQTVIQVQDGKVAAVYGAKGFIEKPKYPMPAWNAR